MALEMMKENQYSQHTTVTPSLVGHAAFPRAQISFIVAKERMHTHHCPPLKHPRTPCLIVPGWELRDRPWTPLRDSLSLTSAPTKASKFCDCEDLEPVNEGQMMLLTIFRERFLPARGAP
jgi:hypothetical protein